MSASGGSVPTRQPPANDVALAPVPREGEEPMYSRPAATSAFGKCTDRIDVAVPTELRELLSMLAMLDEKSLATYCREVLEVHAVLERQRLRKIIQTFGGDMEGKNAG